MYIVAGTNNSISAVTILMKVLPSQQFTTSVLLPISKSAWFDFAVSLSCSTGSEVTVHAASCACTKMDAYFCQ